jgi:hypothetical protein
MRVGIPKFLKILSLGLYAALACTCGTTTGSATYPENTTPVSSDGCTGTVVIGRYRTADCVPGEETGVVTIDVAKSCSSWTRAAPGGTKTDSFTRTQCFRDRFCFTVHPGSDSCAPGNEDGDVELRSGVCQKDKPLPDGTSINAYSKILSGTDACPEAPAGYVCPISASGAGTQGLKAACGS